MDKKEFTRQNHMGIDEYFWGAVIKNDTIIFFNWVRNMGINSGVKLLSFAS